MTAVADAKAFIFSNRTDADRFLKFVPRKGSEDRAVRYSFISGAEFGNGDPCHPDRLLASMLAFYEAAEGSDDDDGIRGLLSASVLEWFGVRAAVEVYSV